MFKVENSVRHHRMYSDMTIFSCALLPNIRTTRFSRSLRIVVFVRTFVCMLCSRTRQTSGSPFTQHKRFITLMLMAHIDKHPTFHAEHSKISRAKNIVRLKILRTTLFTQLRPQSRNSHRDRNRWIDSATHSKREQGRWSAASVAVQ